MNAFKLVNNVLEECEHNGEKLFSSQGQPK